MSAGLAARERTAPEARGDEGSSAVPLELEAERETLAELIAAVVRAVPAHPPLPALGGVWIEAQGHGVTLTATDLETFVTVKGRSVRAVGGPVVVPGRLLAEIVRHLPPGTVSIRADGSRVAISSVGVEFSLAALPAEDFPTPPRIDGRRTRVEAAELARALHQVVPATSTDEYRQALGGVAWSVEGEMLRLSATDGHRLAIRELTTREAADEGQVIVPGRALGAFERLLGRAATEGSEATIAISGLQAVLEAGPATVVTRLIEGRFPDTSQLVPSGYPNRLVADRAALLEAVARVGLLARAATPVVLELGDAVRLRARGDGLGDAVEVLTGATYEGTPMNVALNTRFLADGLEAVDGRRVVLEAADSARPLLLRGEEPGGFLYLVMPVRTEGAR